MGDSIIIYANASNNAALGWLVYELGPPANYKDSIPATGAASMTSWKLNITVRPEWVGSPTLSVYARDVSGLTSQVFSSPADSLRFTGSSIKRMTIPMSIDRIWAGPSGS